MVVAACLSSAAFAAPQTPFAVAQGLAPPPGQIPDANNDDNDQAGLLLRVDRLEADLRRANGQIEELQNQNQRLADELKRFREDVEFRLSGKAPAPAAPAAPTIAAVTPQPLQPLRHSDAFDPNAAPGAAGAPQPLGSTAPSAPLANGLEFKTAPKVGAPLELNAKITEAPSPAGPLVPAAKPPDNGPMIVGSGVDFADGPRNQYSQALEAYKAGQYAAAEDQLKSFLAANAGHRLAPDAVFFLGETYLQRSRPREAAEQYLRLSTDFAKSPRAPEGMLRLGQSLALLGNAEQACATFSELGRRYPAAPGTVKKTAEREMQKDHC